MLDKNKIDERKERKIAKDVLVHLSRFDTKQQQKIVFGANVEIVLLHERTRDTCCRLSLHIVYRVAS